eukprot:1280823-Rhodomonas_salina.4
MMGVVVLHSPVIPTSSPVHFGPAIRNGHEGMSRGFGVCVSACLVSLRAWQVGRNACACLSQAAGRVRACTETAQNGVH